MWARVCPGHPASLLSLRDIYFILLLLFFLVFCFVLFCFVLFFVFLAF